MARQPVSEKTYIQALLNDLAQDLVNFKDLIGDRSLQSIFVGGGTPSLFAPESIALLLEGISQKIGLQDDIEITLEANPSSVEKDKFQGFVEAGINRLSIGIQSFNEKHLSKLGRIHSAEQALLAAEYARSLEVNFNLDLMFGLPEQSLEQALADITQAVRLRPNHLSCYQLTIEPNTAFYASPPPQPESELLWQMQESLQTSLAESDYEQYEVSAYAQAESQCKHNLNYWQFGDYLGIGAGAHGKLSHPESGIIRVWKNKHPKTYQQKCADKNGSHIGAVNKVAEQQRAFEFMLNALRLSHGFHANLFERRTFLPLSQVQRILDKHQQFNLICIDNDWVRPTQRGKSMIDTMLQDYLPE